MNFIKIIPQLPVAEIKKSLIFYKKLNFVVHYQDDNFAVISSDNVKIHLWKSDDLKLVGSSNCQIEVTGLDRLYVNLLSKGIIDSYDTIENHSKVLRLLNLFDPDNNLISFIERKAL
ncbi:hypothetical protein [Gottfriedia acidiceleris]|uniref:hypothetical protein n=1 Tax=Gottfriedia acidiceleris TaxID=371036 RepID=UPI003D25B762